MKLRANPFLIRLAIVGTGLVFGTSTHAANYWFDNNGTTAGFGVVNGGSYDWTAGTPWTTTNTGAFTVAGITWPGGSNLAGLVGAGAATSYTMTLGATDSSTVTLQNLILNSDGTNATAIGAGDVVIGGVGSTGTLFVNAANSIGTAAGTLTINSKYDLGANKTTNFRGGTVIINGVISGTGSSGVTLASGAFGLTTGTLTLAGNNTFTGNTSVASGYTLSMKHANALGTTGGTNTVSSGGTLEVAGGIVSNSNEAITINGGGVNSIGALRAGTGGGTWAGQVNLGDASARIGATAGTTLTVTGSIVNGAASALNISGQSGTGIIVLNPTTSNSYTGATGIVRGILRLGKTDALPTATILDVDSANSVTDAATFDLASFSQTVAALQDTATLSINGKITNSVASTTSTLTVNQASNTSFDGIIENGSGSLVLTKSGAGNLTLNGANTHTGGTNIQNGKLIIGGGNDRLAVSSSVSIGSVTNTGALVLGDGTNARNQTLTGLTSTGLGGAVVGNAATNSTLTLNITSGSNTFGGTLGGAGTNENNLALVKSGAGTLKLTGANTYSGVTTLSTGITQIGIESVGSVGAITSSAMGTGGLTFNGGTLSSDGTTARGILNAVSFTGNAVLGDAANNGKLTFGGALDLGAAARTITVNSEVQLDGSFTNPAATSGLTKNGAGTLTINAANTSFGNSLGFSIQAGTVVASNTASMGNAGQIVTLGASSTTGTLELATDATANAYVLNVGSGNTGAVIVNRATSGTDMTHTMGNSTIGNSTLNIQKGANVSGIGTLEFGGITMSAGVSGLSTGTMLNPTTARVLVSGNITRTGGSANLLTLDGTSSGNLISGSISGSQSLTKSNTSTWELSNANTFTGTTKVTGGTLTLTHNLAIQSSAFDTSGAGTLDVTTINTPTFGGLTSATDYALPANVTSLTLNPGTGTITYSGNLSGGTAGLPLTKTGAGTQVLSGTNSYSGLTTVSGGELNIQNSGAIGGTSVTVSSGAQLALQGGITVSGKTITTSGSGRASGTGAFFGGLQSVSGTNTWSGGVVLGADLSRLGARKNATLVIAGTIDDGSNTFGLVVRNEGAGTGNNGAGNPNTVTILSGAGTYGGNTQLINGLTMLDGGDNRLPVGSVLQFGTGLTNAKFDMNGRNQELAGLAVTSTGTDANRDWNANELTNSSGTVSTLTVNTAANQTFGGSLPNNIGIITGNISLVKSGTFQLTLSGSNSHTQGTRVDEGTLALGHATNTIADNGSVHVNGGTLDLGTNTDTVGAVTLTSGSITGSGAGRLTGTGSNFDVRSGTISAKLGGTVGLDKTTGGTVTISSDNSTGGYTGATTVSAGTLLINGNISTSSLTTVSGTGTLGGSGTVGATAVNSGGTFAPGNSIDSIDIAGDLTLGAGSFSLFEIDTAADISDLAIVSGLLTFGGTLNVNNVGATLVSGDTFNLFDWGTVSGSFSAVNLPSLDPGLSWDHSGLYTTGTITVIPEPGAALISGLGLMMLLRRRRAS